MSIGFWFGYLIGGLVFGGLLGLIGGYAIYRGRDGESDFWQLYREEPFWLAGTSLALLLYLLGPALISYVAPVIVGAIVMEWKIS